MSPQKSDRAQTLSSWSFWLTLLVTLAAIFAPSNLFYGFDQFPWSVRGLRIDYLLPKIYLTDLILLMLAMFGTLTSSFKKIPFEWFEKTLTLLCVALLVRQFFTDFPAAAVMQFVRIGLFGYTGFIVLKNWSRIHLNWVWLGLATSNLLEGMLSNWQFFTQQSLGSYRSLFGEPNLSQSFGLAQGTFGSWGEKILPYGTTAHPNILAAWLVASWLLLLVWSKKITLPKPLKILFLVLSGIVAVSGIITTQSATALGLLLQGLVYYVITRSYPKYFLRDELLQKTALVLLVGLTLSPWVVQWSLTLLPKKFTEQTSVTRRAFLQTTGQKILQQNLLWGVGLNQFAANLDLAPQLRETVRFDQPVHHVIWLGIIETGLLGLCLLTLTLWHTLRKNPQQLRVTVTLVWLLFPSLIWDHYLLTQPTGLLIVWLYWFMAVKKPANLVPSGKPVAPHQ